MHAVQATHPRRRASLAAHLVMLAAAAAITAGAAPAQGAEVASPSPSRTVAAQGCVVVDGVLQWGFKEAFRSYLSSTIAHGQWTVAGGADYETPLFRFTGGEGSYDPATGAGIVGFAGSIRFTGHGGILDTTVANPQVRLLDESSGVLLLDVVGETQQGVPVDESAVEFADLDLAAAITGNPATVTFEGVSVTLSEAGAAAFGTYSAGEPFDDLTVSFATVDCEFVPDSGGPMDAGESIGASPDLGWLAWAVPAGVVAIAAIALVAITVRRTPQ